jgi:hypothetical protein
MSIDDDLSILSDSSCSGAFSFGMTDNVHFDSDSDGEGSQVVTEMDPDDLGKSTNDVLEEIVLDYNEDTIEEDTADVPETLNFASPIPSSCGRNETAVTDTDVQTINFANPSPGSYCRNDNYDTYSVSSEESTNAKKSRKGSLIKKIVENDEAVFISLDLEHGGQKCGVTQLSAVLFRLGGSELRDMKNDVVTREVFNEFVRPPPSSLWDQQCIDVTGLHADHTGLQFT